MRSSPNLKVEQYRIDGGSADALGNNGGFAIPQKSGPTLRVIASDGGGWDHVSVSTANRCPTWEELELVKRLFFREDETVMQLHVPPAEHVNDHPHCLHLWRPQTDDEIARVRTAWGDEWGFGDMTSPGVIPRPPAWMVGIPTYEG